MALKSRMGVHEHNEKNKSNVQPLP